MKRTITIVMAIIMMVIGMVVPANATKAEAAYVVDGKMRFSVSDAVMEAKYYQERDELRSVLTLYDDTVLVIYKGQIEHVWRCSDVLYADVDGAYMNTYAEHIHAEVLI